MRVEWEGKKGKREMRRLLLILFVIKLQDIFKFKEQNDIFFGRISRRMWFPGNSGEETELFVTTGKPARKWHQIAEQQHDTSKHLHLFQFNTFHRKIYSLHQQVVNL